MSNNKKVICFGEVLWDNLPTGRKIGGAPLNVCYHLLKEGVENRIISQVGDDANGKDLLEGVKEWGVDMRYCKIVPGHPTSTVEVHLLDNNKVMYEIVEQVAWDYIEVDPEVVEDIKSADVFVYGSLVARHTVSRATLLHYLEYAKWPVFDVNLREPFYSEDRILQLLSYCKTLKVNEDEIEIIAAWINQKDKNEREILICLFDRFTQLEEVIITKGAQGVAYHSRQTEMHLPAIPVKVADTVGSGDAFLAAFIAGKLLGDPVDESLNKAIALSAFVATQKGGTPPYERADLEALKLL